MKDKLSKNTGGGPALTAGDVDADWQSAETVGDEAPGGDNPTPDQDVVDDIGRALGVEYDDDEELQGGAEIADRDRIAGSSTRIEGRSTKTGIIGLTGLRATGLTGLHGAVTV